MAPLFWPGCAGVMMLCLFAFVGRFLPVRCLVRWVIAIFGVLLCLFLVDIFCRNRDRIVALDISVFLCQYGHCHGVIRLLRTGISLRRSPMMR